MKWIFLSLVFIHLTHMFNKNTGKIGFDGYSVNSEEAPVLKSDTTLIVEHLSRITKADGFRNYQNPELLNRTAEYILSVFRKYADTTWFQTYTVNGITYKNVICRFGTQQQPLIVVGAHYDVCGDQEGADDNGSGVVALLELARMMKGQSLDHPVELVAYSLEEPPYFRTPYMGSYVHAQSLKESGISVYGMLAIEMIGFFSEERGSQSYPVKPMKVAYGRTGDFILLAKRTDHGAFVKRFSSAFNQLSEVRTNNIKAPAKLPGIDFSDHLNYWSLDYDALMVTNTAFYRNKNYHRPSDTMETLDISRMSLVIDAIYQSLLKVAEKENKKNLKFRNKPA
ncbi:MAG: M28 family peptidase [Bacteroidales bacterium]|jgi:hypothetical protein|nr:M28 family peptidase [Bacteroidales bacterium]